MLRLIVIILLFLLSLLTVYKAPTDWLWYVSILVTEFCWVFFSATALLLLVRFGHGKYFPISFCIGCVSLVFFAIPVVDAWRMAPQVESMFIKKNTFLASYDKANSPFHLLQMITGIHTKQITYSTITYDTSQALTLDFYQSVIPGKKPCIIVVHGGSWSGGDSRQLPELNSELAKKGYSVVTINYRLAPKYIFPAPLQDLQKVLDYLCVHSNELSIDTDNFVLLGRSAGAQIVLSAAYKLHNEGIKGVISFYGPADMVWGYANPSNPMVLNSTKVLEDYLGGTYKQVPEQYKNSSATEIATTHSVPTLLLHGENDPLVSHIHDVRLNKKLDSLGVEHYVIFFPWATHGFDWTLNGPAGQISTWSVMKFLKIVTGM